MDMNHFFEVKKEQLAAIQPEVPEDPRADYKRAFAIKKSLEKIVTLTDQILAETVVIKELMSKDYPDVAKFETKDIEDLRTILKVTFRRPVYALLNRWTDNTIGRTKS
jgi:hypothetical protein